MNRTTLTPEPPDDGMGKLRKSIEQTLNAMTLHLPLLRGKQASELEILLKRLAEQIIIEETNRQQCTFPPALQPSWSQRLIQHSQETLARFATLSPLTNISYTPIPLGTDAQGETVSLEYTDRTSGVYIIGQTGYGKSSLMENICVGDFENGHGGLVIDPHGELIEHIIRRLPDNRLADVILLEPGKQVFPIGLQLLEHTSSSGIEVDVNRAVELFDRLWGYGSANPSWGARMSNLLRMSLHVLYLNGCTIAELPHFLLDQDLRKRLVKTLSNSSADHYVKLFWTDYESQRKDKRQDWAAPVMNKVFELTGSREMLSILCQDKTTLNFREIMDSRKIVLLHLDKNLVGGEENVRLIGTALIGECMRSVFSRKAGSPDNPMFLLCVDEFENFVSSEFEKALPQVRKYGMAVVLGNQVYQQLGTLKALVEQLAVQGTYRCIEKDAHERAPIYQGEPEILKREQFKKAPVTDPFTYILSGSHSYTNQRVIAWIKVWELLFKEAKKHQASMEVIENARAINAHYYSVMVGTNGTPDPFLPPPLFFISLTLNSALQKERPDLFGTEDYYTPKSAYTSLYWRFHQKQLDAAYAELENEEAKKELDRIKNLWPNLFAAHTDEELQTAFNAWKTEACTHLREEMLCVAEEFLHRFGMALSFAKKEIDWSLVPPLLHWPENTKEYAENRQRILDELHEIKDIEQFHRDQRGTPGYEEKRQQQFEELWKRIEKENAVEALGFNCDIQTLRSLLTLDRLQWHVTYIEARREPTREYQVSNTPGLIKDKFNTIHACDRWTLVEGQEELLLSFIEPAIEQTVMEAKPLFEAHIRFLRDIQHALAETPIAVTTSETEQVAYGKKSAFETRSEMAGKIMNLEKFHCYVRLGVAQTTQKPCIQTLKPVEGVSLAELELRYALLREQGKQYGTDPAIIEQELQARREQLGILPTTSKPPVKAEPSVSKQKVTDAVKPTGKPVKSTSSPVQPPARPVVSAAPVSSPPALVFDDNYPLLLFHWFYLSLSQMKRLLQKKPSDSHVSERMKKYIEEGLIQVTEWKAPGAPGKAQKVFRLTDTGVKHVEATYHLTSGSRNMALSEHTLAVNDLLITLCLFSQEKPGISLTTMLHELYYKSHGIKVEDGGLEPDGLIQFLSPTGPRCVYCEVDLGNESKEQWAHDKIRKYLLALDAGLLGPDQPIIAVWQPGKNNVSKIVKWTEEIIDQESSQAAGSLFFFTCLNPLTTPPVEFATGAHWYQPFGSGPVPLIQPSS